MDKKAVKEIILASAMYSLGSIFGPLIIIGGTGLLLDKLFGTSPWILLGSILVAFIVTNVLLFKKIKKINRMMENYRQEALVNKDEEEETKA
ncbi:MAG: hypothetical protein PF488_01585 [Patescibacteria group bacterium]|jgi:F0F1-type ATP synthase assembly protein I|nr:hypothetical protein [Patescibacteria group bacterium]